MRWRVMTTLEHPYRGGRTSVVELDQGSVTYAMRMGLKKVKADFPHTRWTSLAMVIEKEQNHDGTVNECDDHDDVAADAGEESECGGVCRESGPCECHEV